MTTGYRLVELDAQNGRHDPVVLPQRCRRPEGRRDEGSRSTNRFGNRRDRYSFDAIVVKDVVIVGSSMKEGQTVETHNTPRAWFAPSMFGPARNFGSSIRCKAGEFGNDTWEEGSWAINGNTGVWTQITVDADLGLVYLPVETPTSDFYGGHRPGNNLFAESLVCVDLKTGQRKWHFQLVHQSHLEL